MKKKINILTIAGLGQRFLNQGYKDLKPLIKVKGIPIFIKSAKSIPKGNFWIFIQRKSAFSKIIRELIDNNFKKYKIINILKKNDGQARSCFRANKYLKKNSQIFVSACDYSFTYNRTLYKKKLEQYDVLIFTTKPKKIHMDNPKSFGWVGKKNRKIKRITCKKIISAKYNRTIIIGSFVFANEFIFRKVFKNFFIKKNLINKEFYLDMLMSKALNEGFKVGEIKVKRFRSWGTPEEYEKDTQKKLITKRK
jgi:bifunctional N-acetylglucosamine-1-phosphate-uridyltransferase/glucosamine-1-phosphate-acetyltransferase GlmU-like protein